METLNTSRPDVGALRRTAGLRRATPGFKDIERRRSELWSMSLLGMGAITTVIALMTVGQDLIPESIRLESLSQWSVLVLLGGLLLSMMVYVAEKERALRSLGKSLMEERVVAEALRFRLSELSHFTEVAKAMNATLDLEEVFEKILDASLELLGGNEASVMLYDDLDNCLRIVASRGEGYEKAKDTVVAIGSGLAGRAAERRSAVLLGPGEHPEEGIHSAMSIPLVRREELLGVLNVVETKGAKAFDSEDLHVLDLFAEYSAIALINARIVSKERETIAKLEELDRLKSDFVATVSHELRTPLTSIIGSARTLTRTGDRLRPEDRLEFLSAIDRQGMRLQRLIEDILTSSKMDSGTFRLRREAVDIKRLAQDLIGDLVSSPFVGDRKIELTAPSEARMWGDPRALQQIFGNLIENACKYSPEGSPIFVRLTVTTTETTIWVQDEGQGIPPADIPYIFDRFHRVDSSSTSKVEGSGIGLSIVKSLVETSGGTITVESEVGKGTTFTVRLPQRSARRGEEESSLPQDGLISSNPV